MKSFVLLSVKVLARKLTTINKQNHPNAGSLWSSFGSHRRKDMAVWILAPQRGCVGKKLIVGYLVMVVSTCVRARKYGVCFHKPGLKVFFDDK